MKRSEMLLHIKEMLLEIEDKKKNILSNDLKFYDRQAADILDTLLGFGMSPPSVPTNISGWEVGKGLPLYKNEWEPENETKWNDWPHI